MENKAKEIRMVDINEIKIHPKNPNRHDKEGIERLKKNIKELGFRTPLVVSKLSGHLIAGHGRLLAAKSLGMDKLPVVLEEFKDEAEEYAHMTADNALASWSNLDLSAINTDIVELGPDFDIELLGIKDFEIEIADKYADKDADAVPEKRKTDIVTGDLFQLGEHRLMCGDSTNPENIDKLLGGKKADMVFTDPPYGISFKIGSFKHRPVNSVAEKTENKWDENLDCTMSVFNYCQTLDVTSQIWWGANYYPTVLKNGKKWIVWDKQHHNDTFSGFELAWTNLKGKIDCFEHRWVGMLKGSEQKEKRLHPTQKPAALAEWCFENYGKPKTVLDLFGGSGSTLIACEKTNRKCFMMEIDPSYCQVIIDRWEKFTSKKAKKLN